MASKRGKYTVKSCYEYARGLRLDASYGVEGNWKKLWALMVPPKVKLFLWRAAHNILPTKIRLISKGMEVGEECGMCGGGYEDVWHSLVSCDFATKCWQISKFTTIYSPLKQGVFPSLNFFSWYVMLMMMI